MSSDEWIDTQEKLPEIDGLVLIHAPTMNPDKPLITTAWYNPGHGWSLLQPQFLRAITHWQSLPGSPKKEEVSFNGG